MKQQTIKAVELTRNIRDRIYEQVKDMSPAEQLAFFREHSRLMDSKAEKPRKSRPKPVHS